MKIEKCLVYAITLKNNALFSKTPSFIIGNDFKTREIYNLKGIDIKIRNELELKNYVLINLFLDPPPL